MSTPHTAAGSHRASYIPEDKLSPSASNQDQAKDLENYDEKATTDVHDVGTGGPNMPTDHKFKQLSWIRLTSVLIVEAIALGS